MLDTEAAYLAGLLDGEGCFRLWRAPNRNSPAGYQFRTCVEIAMCDYATLSYVSALTERKLLQPRTSSGGRKVYKLIWYNRGAAALVRAILPYLRGKKEQALLLLRYEDEIAPGRGRKMTPDLLAKSEALARQISAMKKPDYSSLLIAQS